MPRISFAASVSLGDFKINPEQLEENPSLETFCLKEAAVCDTVTGEEGNFGFLFHYPNLEELWIQDCDLETADFIAQLKNLERCHLERNNITDYSPLKECKRLEYLCVGLDNSEERPDVAAEVRVDWGLHNFGKE